MFSFLAQLGFHKMIQNHRMDGVGGDLWKPIGVALPQAGTPRADSICLLKLSLGTTAKSQAPSTFSFLTISRARVFLIKKKGNSGENRTGTCFTSTLLLCYSQRGKCRLPIKGPTENGSQWFCFEFVTCLVFADCQQLNQLLHCLTYGSDTPSEP